MREYRLTFAYQGACPEMGEAAGGGGGTVVTLSGLVDSYRMEGLVAHAEYAGTLVAVNDRGSSNVTTFNITTPTTGNSQNFLIPVENNLAKLLFMKSHLMLLLKSLIYL